MAKNQVSFDNLTKNFKILTCQHAPVILKACFFTCGKQGRLNLL